MDETRLQQLLAGCAQKDTRALRVLFDSTSGKLLSLAIGILNSRQLGEEALQEAFLQIWDRAAQFDPERAHPMAWMAGITRHRALDLRRRELSQHDRVEKSFALTAPLIEPNFTAASFHTESFQALDHCLGTLSGEQRECLLLAYYQGYTHPEIAQILDRPIGSVKSWVRRGLSLVRECLGL